MTPINFDTIRGSVRGRWLEVLTEIIGGQSLTGKNCPCPGCGGRDRFQFNRQSEAGAFSCRGHKDGGGDGFALLMHALGCDFKRAADLVAQSLGLSGEKAFNAPVTRHPAPAFPAPAVDWSRARGKLASLWHEGKPITAHDPAGRYLQRRGLRIPANSDVLRFHHALPYWNQGIDGKPEFVGKPPAMLARIQRHDGMTMGLHRIYLESDGRKFDHQDLASKKLFKAGELTGCAVRLSNSPAEQLAVAEGIETGMAFQQMTGVCTWATISAAMMPSVWLPEHVTKVYIALDADEAGRHAAQKLAERLPKEGKEPFFCEPLDGCNDWADYLARRLHHA